MCECGAGKWGMLVTTPVLECWWLCPFCGWRVALGAQVVWHQEEEFRSRAEWRVLFVVRENKKARLLQGGADYSLQVLQMCPIPEGLEIISEVKACSETPWHVTEY